MIRAATPNAASPKQAAPATSSSSTKSSMPLYARKPSEGNAMARKALRNTPAIVLTGETRGVLGPLSRDCPTCGAAAGAKCVRTTGGRVGGEDIGGGYPVTLKSFHAKRKKWTPPADMADDPDAEATLAATMTLPYVRLTAEGMSAVNLCASTMDTTRDDAINRAIIYYCRYVLGELP